MDYVGEGKDLMLEANPIVVSIWLYQTQSISHVPGMHYQVGEILSSAPFFIALHTSASSQFIWFLFLMEKIAQP